MMIIRAFKSVNYRLLLALLLQFIIPTIYTTTRIYFIGNLPNSYSFSIASQIQWVSLFYEVVQEGLILPLFHLLGKSLQAIEEFENKVRGAFFINCVAYLLLLIVIMSAARPLVILMAQNKEIIDETVVYVRLESVAQLLGALVRFLRLVFTTLEATLFIYILLVVQLVLTILGDLFLMANYSFSAKLGVNGIPISNCIVYFILIVVGIFLSYQKKVNILKLKIPAFKWMKDWLQIGGWSALESFLRNLAFMVMIIRMVNVVSEQGNYWVANTLIWDWLLVLNLALTDVIQKEVGQDPKNVERKTFGYLLMNVIFSVIWFVTIPLWKIFIRYVMNVDGYETVFRIVLIQTGFYIIFIFNQICDGTLYGLGKTQWKLFQSLVVDVLYYGIWFILYMTKAFTPTLDLISIMFGVGMVVDLIPTLIGYIYVLNKMKLKIKFNLKKEDEQEEQEILNDSSIHQNRDTEDGLVSQEMVSQPSNSDEQTNIPMIQAEQEQQDQNLDQILTAQTEQDIVDDSRQDDA